jgi:ammonium transporter, Amt family
MTSAAISPLSDSLFALTLALLLLAPLTIAGLALINAGLGRARSAAQALLGSLGIVAIAVIVFASVGATLAGNPDGGGHSFLLFGKSWNWLGAGSWLLGGLGSGSPQSQLALLFEFLSVALTALIPWGSGAERMRLTAGCAVAALLAALFFPVAAHWIWNGGWLRQLGANFGLGASFLDGGGAATVHLLGGLGSLAVVWIAGPRRGKFPKEGLATAMPGHNAVYVLFGCLLALAGWMAWNVAGAIVWLHAPISALPGTALNTLLSASMALVAAFAVTRIRFGKPDASICANGWLAGLVASSAGASLIPLAAALLVGLIIGLATPLLVEMLELALSIDDPSGAVTVHAGGGVWGILSVGLFAPQAGQLLAQLVGLAALLGLALPLIYLSFRLLNRVLPFRVSEEGERPGMDLTELGGSAYPEFVIHRDESSR